MTMRFFKAHELKNTPCGFWSDDLQVMSLALCHWAKAVLNACVRVGRFCKMTKEEWYRRQVSILWPSAYKAITIRKTDYKVKEGANDVFRRSAAELHRYNVSGLELEHALSVCNTGAIWW